jgi:hypothetical protein
MHCQYLAAILAKRMKRISPLASSLECLARSATHGAYGFTVRQHGIGKGSDKVVPFRTMHGALIVLGLSIVVNGSIGLELPGIVYDPLRLSHY